jgi:hypothetical protein
VGDDGRLKYNPWDKNLIREKSALQSAGSQNMVTEYLEVDSGISHRRDVLSQSAGNPNMESEYLEIKLVHAVSSKENNVPVGTSCHCLSVHGISRYRSVPDQIRKIGREYTDTFLRVWQSAGSLNIESDYLETKISTVSSKNNNVPIGTSCHCLAVCRNI